MLSAVAKRFKSIPTVAKVALPLGDIEVVPNAYIYSNESSTWMVFF